MTAGMVPARDPAPDAPVADRHQRLAELLRAAQARRPDALNAIVADLTPLLWNVARAQGVDRATAEDVVQNTWLTLLRSLHTIHTPEALVAWTITVTRREAGRMRDVAQRNPPVDVAALVDLAAADPGPADRVLTDHRARMLWEAIAALSPRCRELLRIVAHLPRPDYRQVSAALGIPHGSIGPSRGRCLQKLRARLSADPRWSW